MQQNYLRRYKVAGIGETRIGRLPSQTPLSLALQAAQAARQDAGLDLSEIDGLIVEQAYSDPRFMLAHELAESLGIRPRYAGCMDLGGASAVAALSRAATAIEAGLCNHVLFVNADCQHSCRQSAPTRGRLNWGYQEFEEPFGLVGPIGGYALGARMHMHQFGTPPEALGEIALAMRLHASLNSNAQRREPLQMMDYLNSRFIVEPFRLLDCCQISDYGGAFVVSRVEGDASRPEIILSGYAEAHDHRYLTGATSLTTTSGEAMGQQLWRQTGLGPSEIDLALLYDSFTYTVLVQLEDYGFCRKGEVAAFLESGAIRLGGTLPVNTHGGLLSQGHSNGVFHVNEAVRQLRGEAGQRNVPGARRALVTGAGGILMGSHAAAILERVEK